MIPRKIHYVWVGPKTVPDKVQKLVDGWKRLNPGYEVQRWHEGNIDFSSRFLRAAYGIKGWNRVSDYTRMWVLTKFGGVYLDTDVELVKPLDSLMHNTCFMGFQLKERHHERVNGAVIGAVRGHWFIRKLHEYLDQRLTGCEDLGAFYGPGLITKLLEEEGLGEYTDEPQRVGDITLYPTRWFYPYSWLESFSPERVSSDTVGIHHWDESWRKPTDLKQRLKWKALRLTAQASPEVAFRLMQLRVKLQRAVGGVAPPG